MAKSLELIIVIANAKERYEIKTKFDAVKLKKVSTLDRSKWQKKGAIK
jgi:hypothetical protein